MTGAKGTRIFGIRVTVDPKIIVGGLVVLAGILFWYNSDSEDSPANPTATSTIASAIPASVGSSVRQTVAQRRSGAPTNERGTLRLRPIDPTRGDVDPTLRLDLLRRLATIQLTPANRSLFEIGAIPPSGDAALAKITGPKIKVTAPTLTPPQGPSTVLPLQVNIPFKYYGYVKPSASTSANQGLFLDGDNVLVASEGEVVKQRFLVVELTPNSARLEDTQLKQGQTLPVVPVATQ